MKPIRIADLRNATVCCDCKKAIGKGEYHWEIFVGRTCDECQRAREDRALDALIAQAIRTGVSKGDIEVTETKQDV